MICIILKYQYVVLKAIAGSGVCRGDVTCRYEVSGSQNMWL